MGGPAGGGGGEAAARRSFPGEGRLCRRAAVGGSGSAGDEEDGAREAADSEVFIVGAGVWWMDERWEAGDGVKRMRPWLATRERWCATSDNSFSRICFSFTFHFVFRVAFLPSTPIVANGRILINVIMLPISKKVFRFAPPRTLEIKVSLNFFLIPQLQ